MAMAVVNGYFCANSCDAAKAKKGQDPHPSNDPGSVDGSNNSPRADNPAVVFGGSLSNTLQTYAWGQPAARKQMIRRQRSAPDLRSISSLDVAGSFNVRLDPAIHPPRRTMDARVKHEVPVAPMALLRRAGIDDRLRIALAAQHNHQVGDQRGTAVVVKLGDLLS
jgi:hypothetical protein